ncbi:stress-response protein [Erwiniaceae bacterium BAC15a-03b]|uniref:Stress-response protein n=1 Tax=Winslowiella arboricola TaxID=2978220 RepID=A0A9J6PUC4_9GAMM|nr:stress-response protein [Winslowiella arboricola]MCU5771923.1 stress-response protein [Winslowiella arboricola]MCU5778356.1 stress-response protein [Winslowiella arboricola]
MNSDIIVGRYKQLKGQLWLMWAEWFDNDCAWVAGNNDWLSGILQEDYGREQQDPSLKSTSPREPLQ